MPSSAFDGPGYLQQHRPLVAIFVVTTQLHEGVKVTYAHKNTKMVISRCLLCHVVQEKSCVAEKHWDDTSWPRVTFYCVGSHSKKKMLPHIYQQRRLQVSKKGFSVFFPKINHNLWQIYRRCSNKSFDTIKTHTYKKDQALKALIATL